jgi:hypothetical protein
MTHFGLQRHSKKGQPLLSNLKFGIRDLQFLLFVISVKKGRGKAVLLLWLQIKLHLGFYLETLTKV